MSKYLIIDGYNAINKIKRLEAKKDLSLEASRLSFIKMLMDFMAQKRIFDKVFIVFDSKERDLGIKRDSYGPVETLFTTIDKDADSVIVDMLRAASPKDRISVSSDDNFVRNHAKGFGSDVISIRELEKIIMLKKGNLRGKIREKGLREDTVKGINEELKKHWGLK